MIHDDFLADMQRIVDSLEDGDETSTTVHIRSASGDVFMYVAKEDLQRWIDAYL